MNGTRLRAWIVHFARLPGSVLDKHSIERTEASDMECGREVRHERSYRFRRLDGGVRMEKVRHPAKAVAPMQACAVHLRDRTPKARLAEVANLPQPTIQALNRVPFTPGIFLRRPALRQRLRCFLLRHSPATSPKVSMFPCLGVETWQLFLAMMETAWAGGLRPPERGPPSPQHSAKTPRSSVSTTPCSARPRGGASPNLSSAHSSAIRSLRRYRRACVPGSPLNPASGEWHLLRARRPALRQRLRCFLLRHSAAASLKVAKFPCLGVETWKLWSAALSIIAQPQPAHCRGKRVSGFHGFLP